MKRRRQIIYKVRAPAAEKLAKELKQTTVVISGVHVEKANKEAIKKLKVNSMQATEAFIRKMKIASISSASADKLL